MNVNLLSSIPRGNGQTLQLVFKESPVCIPPINLSTNESVAVNSQQLHSPHIKVAGKSFETVGDWYLTGTLDSHARCGEFVRALGCEDFGKDDNKHDRVIETYSCHRPGCPICYESWAFREAEKATERLLEGQQLYHNTRKNFTLKHTVFSPPVSEHAKIKRLIEQGHYNVLKRLVLDLMKKAGVIGGCVTPHFWRQVGEKEELPDNVTIPAGLKDGDWYFSPHFHGITAGFLIPSDKFFNETGWVYKNLGKRKSIKNTVFYFLTHCANHEKHHAVSWFGIYSYNKLVTDFIEIAEVNVPCSACGKALHEYALDYDFDKVDTLIPDWNQDKGIHYRKIKIRHFKIRSTNSVSSPNEHFLPIASHPRIEEYLDLTEAHEILRYTNV